MSDWPATPQTLPKGGTLNWPGATSGIVSLTETASGSSYTLTWPGTAPTANQLLKSDGSGNLSWVSAGSILPAGASFIFPGATSGTASIVAPATVTSYTWTLPGAQAAANQILKNNGSGTLSWVDPGAALPAGQAIQLPGATSGAVSLTTPATVTSYTLKLPAAQGAANQMLANDGSGNLSWVDAGGGGLSGRVTSQFDKTDTTLANVGGLSVTLTAGRVYRFVTTLHVSPDAVGGHKYAIAGTCTATAIIYQINALNNGTMVFVINSRQTALAGSAGTASGTSVFTTIEGTIIVNAGGTLTVQFAQNAASGTSSVLVGSTLMIEDIT